MIEFDEEPTRMVDRQIARRGISDSRVLDAFRRVAREKFLPESLVEFAYQDTTDAGLSLNTTAPNFRRPSLVPPRSSAESWEQ